MGGLLAKAKTDILQGTLALLVLKTLARGAMHGYGITLHIQRVSSEVLRIEEGSLYPALQRMLKAKWVTAEWGLSARNRKVRIYKITAEGRKQLEQKVSSFERMLSS